MTAVPSEEPGRPIRRRRRRRRSKGRSTPHAANAPETGAGTGSSDPAPLDPTTPGPSTGGDEASPARAAADPPRKRRRRRPRRRKPKPAVPAVATPAGAISTPEGTPVAAPKAGRRRRRRPKRKASTAGPPPRIRTEREVSAGGVVYRRNGDGALEILLASRRTRRGDLAWGLAKGGIEAGESNEAAAIREVKEETGIVAEIEGSLGATKYVYVWDDVRIRKTVHFFLMRATGGDPDDRDDEMEEVRWFPLERAMKRAAYRGEREMLVRAADLLGS